MKRTPQRSDARASRDRLILAAEQLFAERGIDGVSLREINQAAGQKNVSGLQYHFGTKADLLAAVFHHRTPAIEARRRAMLDGMKAAGQMSDLRQVLGAMVVPFSEQLDTGRNERAYVRFVAQLYSHQSIREFDISSASYRETFRMAERLLLAKLPAKLARQRLSLQIGHFIHALADLEHRMVEKGRPATPGQVELFVSDLLDTAVGALTAPISPATATLLRRR
jgi:AcrR family transcriptional regulator